MFPFSHINGLFKHIFHWSHDHKPKSYWCTAHGIYRLQTNYSVNTITMSLIIILFLCNILDFSSIFHIELIFFASFLQICLGFSYMFLPYTYILTSSNFTISIYMLIFHHQTISRRHLYLYINIMFIITNPYPINQYIYKCFRLTDWKSINT